jgi:hypothetical protein
VVSALVEVIRQFSDVDVIDRPPHRRAVGFWTPTPRTPSLSLHLTVFIAFDRRLCGSPPSDFGWNTFEAFHVLWMHRMHSGSTA